VSRGASPLLAPAGGAYDAAKLRWATLEDADRLERLFDQVNGADGQGHGEMPLWLEHGGAVLLEDAAGVALCAVRWRESGEGWDLDLVATLPEAEGMGFDRWLMTKVEALAIRYNIPSLTVSLPDDRLVGYYRRLGYQPDGPGPEARREARDCGLLVRKRVGGTWQLQEGSCR
jgi:GNAT superfamily N-acetyltransferase